MIRFLPIVLAAAGLAIGAAMPARAGEPTPSSPAWRQAVALSGEPREAADFTHFSYANPDAPKGGQARFALEGSFDSTNVFLSVKGTAAAPAALVYDTLMTPSLDEEDISASYPLIAEAMRYPDDYAWAEYRLDPAARWQDGTKVSAADVVWSFDTLKEIYAPFASYYAHVTKAEDAGDGVVRFSFDAPGNRELPKILGQLYVLPRHWWEGKDAAGKRRDIRATTLEPPMGSGPYVVASVDPGRRIVLRRDPNYWGAKLPANAGQNNFGEMSYEYYLDPTVMMEAFKAGKYDFRMENSASRWVTGYDFPAAREGRVIRATYPRRSTGVMQAMVPNLRRDKFKDERVRRALNDAFDFETLRRTLMHDQFDRVNSYFFGTELASSGLPGPAELAILEPLRNEIPTEVFTTPYSNPVGGSPEAARANLRQAVRLFAEAGWTIRDGKMRNAGGEAFTIAYPVQSEGEQRTILPYARSLDLIGVKLDIRLVDSAQYQNLLRDFDFDMVTNVWASSLSPGNEQREYWGSQAADQPGSQNVAGIRDPGVDALIDKVVYARDRNELIAAARALDRVLLAHNFVIPQFYSTDNRYAYWDRFGRPERLPEYSFGFPAVWWYDAEKAARLGTAP